MDTQPTGSGNDAATQARIMAGLDFMDDRTRDEVAHLREVMDERDRRYTQKFEDQEKATIVRQDASDKEFHEHLIAVREENKLALGAADKAVTTALAGQEKAVTAAFAASNQAIDKADKANEKRFDSVNEFRAQLNDVINSLMPRAEGEARTSANAQRIAELAALMATFITRDESTALAARNTERVQELRDRMNRSEGKDKGVAQSWGVLVGAIATIVAVATLIIVLTR